MIFGATKITIASSSSKKTKDSKRSVLLARNSIERVERRERKKRARRTIERTIGRTDEKSSSSLSRERERNDEDDYEGVTNESSSSSSSSLRERLGEDIARVFVSVPRIALGGFSELVNEKNFDASDLIDSLQKNVAKAFNDGKIDDLLMEMEREFERLERKGAKYAKPLREQIVKPILDEAIYEKYFEFRDEEEEDGGANDGDSDSDGFYDASKDTGVDDEVERAANDVANALSGLDLADLYSNNNNKEEEAEDMNKNGIKLERLNIIAESASRQRNVNGLSPQAAEFAIEDNLSNVVMETATISASKKRSMEMKEINEPPKTIEEYSKKYYSSTSVGVVEPATTRPTTTKTTSSNSNVDFLNEFNGTWKRSDSLDDKKAMDLMEMNMAFRAANIALNQLNVDTSSKNLFKISARYGIISVNETYPIDGKEETKQTRRDARSGGQFGKVSLANEKIILESRWDDSLAGQMREEFSLVKSTESGEVKMFRKVYLELKKGGSWNGVYEYKRAS